MSSSFLLLQDVLAILSPLYIFMSFRITSSKVPFKGDFELIKLLTISDPPTFKTQVTFWGTSNSVFTVVPLPLLRSYLLNTRRLWYISLSLSRLGTSLEPSYLQVRKLFLYFRLLRFPIYYTSLKLYACFSFSLVESLCLGAKPHLQLKSAIASWSPAHLGRALISLKF